MKYQAPTEYSNANISKDRHYKYPMGLDLHPNSELHMELVSRINNMAAMSKNEISKKYPTWNEIDRHMSMYVDLDADEIEVQKQDARKPVSIIVPEAYAIRESIVARNSSILLGEILFPYEGIGPEDTVGAMLLQHVVQRQMNKTAGALTLYTMLKDDATYGIGPVAITWTREFGKKREMVDVGYNALIDGSIPTDIPTGTVERVVDFIRWEGSEIVNIDPYLYLPDPNVPVQHLQKGEFVGWNSRTNYMSLISQEKANPDYYFNAKYVDETNPASFLMKDYSERNLKDGTSIYGWSAGNSKTLIRPIDELKMYVRLIPEEWKLGKGDSPEIWIFSIANDSIITQCSPIGVSHNMFPVVTSASGFDGYGVNPISKMEIAYPSSKLISWYISSNVMEQRKGIHNTWVFDPQGLNELDLKKAMSSGGGLVRTRRARWGQGVKDLIEQMKVNNVTDSNMGNSQLLSQILEKALNSTDAVQGAFDNAPERRTKAEYSGTVGQSNQRVGLQAMLIQLMAMRPMGMILAENTKELMSQDIYVKLIGGFGEQVLAEKGIMGDNGKYLVSPKDIQVNIDIESVGPDVATHSNPDTLLQLLQLIMSSPVLSQQFDMASMVIPLARRLGEKNFSNYRIQLMPNQAAMNTAAQGGMNAIQ